MLIKEGTAGIEKPTFLQKMGALLKDPLKFGPGWQMVFMNFTVSGVGISWPSNWMRFSASGRTGKSASP